MTTVYILLSSLLLAVIFLTSNYISLIYGLKLGKSMQKDIPDPPLKQTVEAVKRHFRVRKENKSYIKRKEKKEETSVFD
jgi:hypothetical protein